MGGDVVSGRKERGVNTCFSRIWEPQQHAHMMMTANTEEVVAERRGDNVKATERCKALKKKKKKP